MLTFWLSALLLIAVSLVLILPAFWGRYRRNLSVPEDQNIDVAKERLSELHSQLDENLIEQDQYDLQKQELEKSLAIDIDKSSGAEQKIIGDKKILHVLSIVFFIPVVTFILYLVLGSPEVLFKENVAAKKPVQAQQQQPPHSIEEMLSTLERKLKENPDNLKGWMMLGRSYMSLDRFSDAAQVFEKITARFGEQASMLLAEADALAMMQSGSMIGKPAKLVKKALTLEPNNLTGLWLAGLASQEGGDDKQAIIYWQQAENNPQLDPSSKQKLLQLIAGAEQRSGIKSSEVKMPVPVKPLAGKSVQVQVKVDIAEQLKQKTKPTDIVFIFARAKTGPRMPLAIVRKQVADLPVEVVLSDKQAMMPNMAISNFDEVVVSARVSFSGQAIVQSGDLSAKQVNVQINDNVEIGLLIDQVVR